MTDPRAFLSFLRLTTDQNLNQKQTGSTGGDPQVLPPVSGSPKRSIYRHLNASRLENHPFIDTVIHKVLKIPFYRRLNALCLQKDQIPAD
jgi:hypothetical protein